MTLQDDVSVALERIPIDYGGGCSLSKARVLADLIARHRIRKSIDIGIYRGRSFFPQAFAHKRTGGVVYGIDPFSTDDAREHDHVDSDRINSFLQDTDFESIYQSVQTLRAELGVAEHALVIRERSVAAARQFSGGIGLIHIDGNHDTEPVLADVAAYMPLLARNGFLIMDDISWPSVKPAVDRISVTLPLIFARVDTFNDYAVFQNTTNRRRIRRSRTRVALVGEAEPRYQAGR